MNYSHTDFYELHVSSSSIKHVGGNIKWYCTSIIMGMKLGGFCLVTKLGFLKFSGLWFTKLPKRHISPTNLSQALCTPDRDLLNYFPYEGTSEDNVRYYAHPLGAGFHVVPLCTQVF